MSRFPAALATALGILFISAAQAADPSPPTPAPSAPAAITQVPASGTPIVLEAGGTFTDWQGRETIHAGEGIATNGKVLADVLAITRGA